MDRWLHDDCWAFAIAVFDLTGWELGWVRDGAGRVPLHAFAIAPDGRYVDASGYTDAPGIKDRYRIRRPVFEVVSDGKIGAMGSVEDEAIAAAAADILAMEADPFPAIAAAKAPPCGPA